MRSAIYIACAFASSLFFASCSSSDSNQETQTPANSQTAGNESGQSGSESGQSGNESGQSGSESGQSGSESGQSGNESGQSGNESGQSGNESGQSGSDDTESKPLVVYFSWSGNTEKLANLIHDKVGGDIVKIVPTVAYPTVYEELADYAKDERDQDKRPAYNDLNVNMDDYKVVFVGYPIWWYTLPMIMYTFFDNNDFAGKTIVPFNTHLGSGDGGTYDKIKEFEPNATVLKGLPISGSDMNNDQSERVENWLKDLDLI